MDKMIKIVGLLLLVLAVVAVLDYFVLSRHGNSQSTSYENTTLDQQLGLVYNNNTNLLSYNVTAVAQTDPNGTGPSYILNALSNAGYWYQLGLSYNWTEGYPGFEVQLSVAHNATNSTYLYTNSSVSNCSGVGYSYPFEWSGKINPNDVVLLQLSIRNGTVYVYTKDWKTGAYADASFNGYGANTFIGGQGNESGYFTGLMTEEYRNTPNIRNQSEVVYQPHGMKPSPVSLFADEFYGNCTSYNVTTLYNLNTSTIAYNRSGAITSNGVTLSYSNGTFVTG